MSLDNKAPNSLSLTFNYYEMSRDVYEHKISPTELISLQCGPAQFYRQRIN